MEQSTHSALARSSTLLYTSSVCVWVSVHVQCVVFYLQKGGLPQVRCTTQAEKGTAERIGQSQLTRCSDYRFTVHSAYTLSAHCVELMPTAV